MLSYRLGAVNEFHWAKCLSMSRTLPAPITEHGQISCAPSITRCNRLSQIARDAQCLDGQPQSHLAYRR